MWQGRIGGLADHREPSPASSRAVRVQLWPLFPVLGSALRHRRRRRRLRARPCAGVRSRGARAAGAARRCSGAAPVARLDVEVDNLRSAKGMVRVCLTADPDNFPACVDDARAVTRSVPAGVHALRFDGLPHGDYAVAVIHDENGNDKLDTLPASRAKASASRATRRSVRPAALRRRPLRRSTVMHERQQVTDALHLLTGPSRTQSATTRALRG